MDDAFDRRAERLARRVRIGVRLVFCPAALALIVFAWQRYHGNAASGHPIEQVGWAGVTSQGEQIVAITGDARLAYLNTYLRERCSDGSLFTFHWMPGEPRFVQRGATVRGRSAQWGHTTTGEAFRWDNRLWASLGEHPRGTVRGTLVYPYRPGIVRCDSGPVAFALTRTAAPSRSAPNGAR
jgi:hypothetical protein